jgi:hypothetical protein
LGNEGKRGGHAEGGKLRSALERLQTLASRLDALAKGIILTISSYRAMALFRSPTAIASRKQRLKMLLKISK